MGAFCAAGCLAGVALTPDLDQEGLSRSEWFLVKWTLGLGFFWPMIWYPYARALKHRSVFSHFPVLGTVGRLIYLTLFLAIPLYFARRWPNLNVLMVLWAVVGLVVSDTAHWVMDTWWCETPVNGRRRLHLRRSGAAEHGRANPRDWPAGHKQSEPEGNPSRVPAPSPGPDWEDDEDRRASVMHSGRVRKR